MLTAIITATALASPGSAGGVHMGASQLQPGSTWAGGSAIAAWTVDGGTVMPALEAGAALGERGAFSFQTSVVPSIPATVGSSLAFRHNIVQRPRLRFAGTGHIVGLNTLPGNTIDWWQGEPGRLMTWWSPGIALETGSETVFFDLSVPIWGLSTFNQYVGVSRSPIPLGGTLGVDFVVSDRSRLRLGVPELLSYSYRSDSVYFDIGGITIGALGVVWTKIGGVF